MSDANRGGNTRRWRKVRQSILERDKGICHWCSRPADQVDHVKPRAAGGNDDPRNLVAACAACNQRRGARDGQHVTVVIGPAGSGKSTYVRDMSTPGDIVVDFDLIAQALGSPVGHDHDRELRWITYAAWKGAVSRLWRARDKRGWLIHADPSPEQIEEYRSRNATLVTIDPATHTATEIGFLEGHPGGRRPPASSPSPGPSPFGTLNESRTT